MTKRATMRELEDAVLKLSNSILRMAEKMVEMNNELEAFHSTIAGDAKYHCHGACDMEEKETEA